MGADRPQLELVPPGQPTKLVADAGAAAVASACAPWVYFDAVTVSGVSGGVAFLTVEAMRHLDVNGVPLKDFVVTGHLRCPLSALGTLKQAIEQIEALVRPGPAAARN